MLLPFRLGPMLSKAGLIPWLGLTPFDKVYELGSRVALDGWGGGSEGAGGGVAGVDCFKGEGKVGGGGGGGGAAEELDPLPKAFRAAWIATD